MGKRKGKKNNFQNLDDQASQELPMEDIATVASSSSVNASSAGRGADGGDKKFQSRQIDDDIDRFADDGSDGKDV